MFKKNTAVVAFGVGHFINTSTGAAVTTGTPVCKRTLDGTGGPCANAAAYNTNGAVWEIDLDAADMNGDTVILSFTLTNCLPISYTVKTVTKLVSELKDETMRGTDNAALASVLGAAVGASISADIAAVKAETALIVADTNELQTDDYPTSLAAIKAKTDNLPASPAAVGSAMALADDAITSAKFDESTAFPLKSADTAATAIARVGADADTLETLSDQIDLQATVAICTETRLARLDATVSSRSSHSAADVWSVATRTLTSFGTLISDIWHHLLTGITTAATIGKLLKDNIDAAITTRAPESGGNVAAIKAKTDNLPADPASETNVNANETKIDAIDTVVDAVKVVTDKVATALELDGSVYRYTANALEQAPSGGATVAQIADGVWDEAAGDHVAAGSMGKKLNDVTGGSPVNIQHDSTVIVTDS